MGPPGMMNGPGPMGGGPMGAMPPMGGPMGDPSMMMNQNQ